MIRIEFKETETRWFGAVTGFIELRDKESKSKMMRVMLHDAMLLSRASGTPLREVLVHKLSEAKEKLENQQASGVPENPPALMTKSTPRPGREKNPPDDRYGVNDANGKLIDEIYPNSAGYIDATSFDEFKTAFFQSVKGFIVDTARLQSVTLIPENFQAEILTSDLFIQLGSVLKRSGDKGFETFAVKRFLDAQWLQLKLHKLDRFELAEKINALFGTKYKPDAVWKIANRLGLVSSRLPGPKGFEV